MGKVADNEDEVPATIDDMVPSSCGRHKLG